MLLVSPALAQTPVSGTITENTRWTTTNGPYVVSGDLVVQNDAVLSIDPGVTVYMASSSSLTVESGGVQALGTAPNPIRVLSDKTRTGLTGAPGDYKAWTFNSGATDTQLEHVVFEHGAGLIVQGSAPALNYLDLRNNQGAAITVDLSASPSGIGNRASGNGLNGIAVPAGEITGSIRWGVRGIPYVVQSGIVSVGRAPTITEVSPSSLLGGETTEITVSGTRLNGVVNAASTIEGLGLQIKPGATDTRIVIAVTVPSDVQATVADLDLLVSAGQVHQANAFAIQPSQPVLTTVTPATIYSGQPDTQITLEGRNFRAESHLLLDEVEVATLSSNATSLTAALPTQTNSGSRKLKLRTPDPSVSGQFFQSNELTLTVLTPAIQLPSSISLLRGESKQVQLSVPYAAPVGGIAIALASSAPSRTEIPSSVIVPEGQTSVEFTVRALSAGSGTLTGSAPGFTADSIGFNIVNPPNLSLQSDAPAYFVGGSYPLRVTASSIAGPDGIILSLISSDPAIVSVPATATIASGENEIVLAMAAGVVGSAVVTVEAAGFELGSLQVAVNSDSLHLPSGVWIQRGASRTISLSIGSPAPVGGLVVTLTTPYPETMSVPASVTIPEGRSSTDLPLAVSNTWPDSVPLTASAPNYQAITVSIRPLAGYPLEWDAGQVRDLYVPLGQTLEYAFTIDRQVPVADLTFTMVSNNPAVVAASSSTTITQANGGVGTLSLTGQAPGETTVTLSAPGLLDRSVRVIVLKDPELRFTRTEQTVGIRMYTAEGANSIGLYADGQPYTNSYNSIPIKFNYGAPGIVIAPTSYGLPAGKQNHGLTIYGPDAAMAEPVVVDAVAKGFASPAQKLMVTVARPVLEFTYLSLQRYAGDGRTSGSIQFTVPGDTSGFHQRLKTSTLVQLTLTHENGTNSGVTLENGTVYFAPGSNSGNTWFTGPTSAGSYTVTATSTLADSVTSESVVVTDSEYRLGLSNWTWYNPGFEPVLGRGMTLSGHVFRLRNGSYDAQAVPLTVSLQCVPAEACTVTPQILTIPANQVTQPYSVTYVGTAGGVTPVIEGVASGYPTMSIPIKVVDLTLKLRDLDRPRSVLSQRDGFKVELASVTGESLENNRPTLPIRVDLAIADATPANVVDGFLGYPGGYANGEYGPRDYFDLTELSSGAYQDWNNEYTLYVAPPQGAGSYRVQASMAGGISVTSPQVVVQSYPTLHFQDGPLTLGRGMTKRVYLNRVVDGESTTIGTQNVVWTCLPTTACEVDPTSQFNDGSYNTSAVVRAIGLSNGAQVVLRASAEGSQPVELPLTIVDPVLELDDVSLVRDLTEPDLDYIYPRFNVPGNQSYQEPMDGFRVRLEVVEADPNNVVNGISSGGSAQPSIELDMRGGAASAAVSMPNVVGTYKIKASIVRMPEVIGEPMQIAPIVSGLVEVRTDSYALTLNSDIVVGVGMEQSVQVGHQRNGTYYADSQPRTVHLTCTPATKCQVPATVVIPAYWNGTSFPLQGLALTDGELATLTVTPEGYGPGNAKSATIRIVPVRLAISSLEAEQRTETMPNYFYIRPEGLDGEEVGEPSSSNPFTWELVDADPPNIASVVRAVYEWDEVTGNQYVDHYEPVQTLSLWDEYFMSTPSTAGSYRLKVAGSGMEAVSEPITVLPAVGAKTLAASDGIVIRWHGEYMGGRGHVERLIGDEGHLPDAPLTVSLACVSSWGCSVPASVTIPAGQSRVNFEVGPGNGNNDDEAVIEISADGYEPLNVPVVVNYGGGS